MEGDCFAIRDTVLVEEFLDVCCTTDGIRIICGELGGV